MGWRESSMEGFLKYRSLQMLRLYLCGPPQKFCEPQFKAKYTTLEGAGSSERSA